jgi:hypothetical protein
MRNFTLIDTLGILKACLALFPFMLAPGYVAGWVLNLFEFRQRRLILRLILALPLTIAICPMPTYLLARFFELGLWLFYIVTFAACALLLANEIRRIRLHAISRHAWVGLGLIALWVIVAVGSMVDLQIGDELYPPIAAFDHSTRTALTVAIARHIPPSNPFFAKAAAPLRYHYLWLLFCSLPMKVFHLVPRYAVYSGVVWCGVALICTIALGIKFVVREQMIRVQEDIERTTLLAVGLLAVTGLDILPTLYLGLAHHSWAADMEWWNDVQITSWADSMLWVPHNLSALIACFVAFVMLRHQADIHRKWATAPIIVAGLAFASAAGMSVYVTFTFVVAIALWLVVLILRKGWSEFSMFLAAGALALLCALPFLTSLRGPGGGEAFVGFALRPFSMGIYFLHRMGIHLLTLSAVAIGNALLLPINYVLELGFFLAILILRQRQVTSGKIEVSTNELAAWTLIVTSFVIGTFMRSSTINTNDLGTRCFLPTQLILLLWAAVMIHEVITHDPSPPAPRPWVRRTLAALLLLGIIGTAYQVFMLRMFPVLADRVGIRGATWVDMDRHFGKRAYALRSAYEVLDAQLPASAVLQSNPSRRYTILHSLYSGHDAAAGDAECATAFGGDPTLCAVRVKKLTGLFASSDGSNVDGTCHEYGIDALVVEDLDRVWHEPSSWVWGRRPIVANDYVRVFHCGVTADSASR